MNTPLKNLTTSLFLSATLLGCTKPSQSPQATVQSWDLEALAKKEQAYYELNNPTPQTTRTTTETTPLEPKFVPVTQATLYTPSQTTNLVCYIPDHTNHALLSTQLTKALADHQRVQQAYSASIQTNLALLETTRNQTGMIENLQAINTSVAAYAEKMQKEEELQKRIQAESILVQTLFSVPGYVIPGNPLETGEAQDKRVAHVNTAPFSLPRVVVNSAQLDELVMTIGELGYTPENTQGAFAEWLDEAHLPQTAFPRYLENPEKYDQAAELFSNYARTLSGPVPGVVTWTNSTGMHYIGPVRAVEAWKAKRVKHK